MIHNDNKWHIRDRKYLDVGYKPLCASKVLTRFKKYELSGEHNIGTHLHIQENIGKDYPYTLSIYFTDVPLFGNHYTTIPIECKPGDIESACNIADDLYRSYCTEIVKYFTEDCKILPEI